MLNPPRADLARPGAGVGNDDGFAHLKMILPTNGRRGLGPARKPRAQLLHPGMEMARDGRRLTAMASQSVVRIRAWQSERRSRRRSVTPVWPWRSPWLAACGQGPAADAAPESGDKAVAKVDGKTVWVSDVKREAVAQGLIGEGEPLDTSSDLFRQMLDEVVDQKLLAAEAAASASWTRTRWPSAGWRPPATGSWATCWWRARSPTRSTRTPSAGLYEEQQKLAQAVRGDPRPPDRGRHAGRGRGDAEAAGRRRLVRGPGDGEVAPTRPPASTAATWATSPSTSCPRPTARR